ncbi:MAG: ABC transporter permease [Candidatus Rifleibacteriota bacterium]
MTLAKMAWRNIWRNTTRTMIQVFVIAGSLFFAIWMQNLASGSYNMMIEQSVRSGSGHLAFQHPDYLRDRKTELVFNAERPLEICKNISDIDLMLPRLQIPGLVRSSRETSSAVITGVDFADEAKVNVFLSEKRKVDGKLPGPNEPSKAYVGIKLAERLQIKIGQKMVFMFQNIDGVITSKLYRISGLFRSGVGKVDSTMVFVERKELAKSFGRENVVHEIALILKNRSLIENAKKKIESKLSETDKRNLTVHDWTVTMKQVADMIKVDHTNLEIMIMLLYVLVAIGTINLLLMSVLERTREFGLLRAIGLGKSRIQHLIGFEAFYVGIIGSINGFLSGCAASFYSWHYGLDFSGWFDAQEVAGMLFEPIVKSNWDWPWMFGLSCGMILMVVLASIYPASKAMKVSPSEAMRKY